MIEAFDSDLLASSRYPREQISSLILVIAVLLIQVCLSPAIARLCVFCDFPVSFRRIIEKFGRDF